MFAYIKGKLVSLEATNAVIEATGVGYEMRISPLQMLVFYNAVANKGKMMQPMIVRRVQEDDDVVEDFEPVLMREKICSDSTLLLLSTLLEGVVERGTARTISSKEYKIAGSYNEY